MAIVGRMRRTGLLLPAAGDCGVDPGQGAAALLGHQVVGSGDFSAGAFEGVGKVHGVAGNGAGRLHSGALAAKAGGTLIAKVF